MAFNTPNFGYTRSVKDRLSREAWNNMSPTDIKAVEYQGLGIRNIVESIIEYAMKKKYRIVFMHEIHDAFVLK